jgi:prepilin-type N-terminal cleavage/methylation domain-containing protein
MHRNKSGFTLIELLIVVSIIGILTIAAVTAYTGVQLKAARSEAYTNLEMIRLLQEQLFADSGCYGPLVGPGCPTVDRTYSCLFNDNDNCTLGPLEIAESDMLPRFRPGPGRRFDYTIQVVTGRGLPLAAPALTVPYDGATVNFPAPDDTKPCFIATATGAVGNVLDKHDVFAIDCNNNRNF